MLIFYEPSLIILLTISIALTLAFMIIYFTNERQKYLLVWTAAWGVYCLGFFLFIIGAQFFTGFFKFFMPAAEILALLNCYLLLYGLHIYDGTKINYLWMIFFIVESLWIFTASLMNINFIIKASPPAVFFFTILSYTGYLCIKGVKNPGIERTITGILIIAWGIFRLYLPFNWINKELSVTELLAGSTLIIMVSLFIILAYLQDTRRLFISEKRKAEESDRIKSSFLANMSHEIRTPLNAILGFTQLLGKAELPPKDRNLFIQNIRNSGEKLLSLLDDILDISKIEANALKIFLSDVSINRIIDELISMISISRKITDNRITIQSVKPLEDGDDIIITDEKRLFQILSNLMNNAVKFTEKGIITVGYNIEPPEFISFYVRDTGIGISAESIKNIFTPFFQEGKIPAAGGTGLGLTIAKGLIESLGGQIQVKSALDEGTEISFTIRYIKGDTAADNATIDISDYNMSGKKMLLVEDEPINRKLIEKFIESTGAVLISTESGTESVNLCSSDKKIDLVLMDITLPDIDGYTAISQIKKVRPELPIIVQSANAMPEHRDLAKKAGADSFIAKPIKREELFNLIATQLFDREMD